MVVVVAIGLMVLLLVLLRLEVNQREIRKRTIAAPALKRRAARERKPEIEVFFDSSSFKK